MPTNRISLPNIAIPVRSRGKEKIPESPRTPEPAPHIPLNMHVAPELQARAPRPYSTSAAPIASTSKATDACSPGLNRAHARVDLGAKFAAFSQRLKKEAAPASSQGASQKDLPKTRDPAASPRPARPMSAAPPSQTHVYTPPAAAAVAYGYPAPYPPGAHYPNGPYGGPYHQPPYQQAPCYQAPYYQAPYYPGPYRQAARRNGVEAFFSKYVSAVQNVAVVMLSGFSPRYYMQSLAAQADRNRYQQQAVYTAPQANYYAPHGYYYQPHGYQAPR